MWITHDGIADTWKWLPESWCLWCRSQVLDSQPYTSCCSNVPPPAGASGGLFNIRSTRSCPKHLQCVTHLLSAPITLLTTQQPLASGITCVTPDQIDQIFWGVPGVCGHCWKYPQLAESTFWHQPSVTTWTISKCSSSFLIHSLKKEIPVTFPNILTLHSSIWVVSFFWTFLIWTGRILFEHLISKYLKC